MAQEAKRATSLLPQLGETHGVLVYHAATLPPSKMAPFFWDYGKPSVTRSYNLVDHSYATVVFFSTAASNVDCYRSLTELAHDAPGLGIGSVGWLHESEEETFLQRPYVASLYASPAAAAPRGPRAPSSSSGTAEWTDEEKESGGYLAVYWKGVAAQERAAVTQLLREAAEEVFEDAKEGGRAFARFPTEDAADTFHSQVCLQHPAVRRSLSYADANDFAMAKKKS